MHLQFEQVLLYMLIACAAVGLGTCALAIVLAFRVRYLRGPRGYRGHTGRPGPMGISGKPGCRHGEFEE